MDFMVSFRYFSRNLSFLRLIGAWVLLSGGLDAGVVNWGSNLYEPGFDSRGVVLGSGFRFELGGFAGGFVPTPANMDAWAANWVAVGASEYRAEEGGFLGESVVGAGAAGLGQAYVWGYNERSGGAGEWLLIRAEGWRFPAERGEPAMPLTWQVGEAEAVWGAVRSAGMQFQTAPVPAAPAAALALRRQMMPEGPAWAADPDADGIPSGVEYALGSDPHDPRSCAEPQVDLVAGAGGPLWRLQVPRRPDAPVRLRVEVSRDLRAWTPAPDVQLLQETPDALLLQVPAGGSAPGFLRLCLEPPTLD